MYFSAVTLNEAIASSALSLASSVIILLFIPLLANFTPDCSLCMILNPSGFLDFSAMSNLKAF